MNRILKNLKVSLILFSFGIPLQSFAKEYPLPPANSRLVGEIMEYIVPDDGRSLESIAQQYDVGLLALMSANPGIDPLLPEAGRRLIVPSLFLLPDSPRKGIVVNLSEMRLYYYPKGKNTVVVYPIGIGQLGRDTPVMQTRVSARKANPTWTPTANIRKHYAAQGITLPAVVPAGPDNPMGLHSLRLAAYGGVYLLHGTNADFGIGLRVSSGCIRLRPHNIEHLFNEVAIGTPVAIIDEPLKIAIEPDGRRYIEVHQPLSRKEEDDPQTKKIVIKPKAKVFLDSKQTDSFEVSQQLVNRYGYPIDVTM